MGRIIIKKVKPTLMDKKLYNYGRQSSMRSVYNEVKVEGEKEKLVHKDIIETKSENKKNNKSNTKDTVMMTTNEKIELANEILNDKPQVKAKRIRADKGLIERKENTIILTEDNRELLKD